MNENFFCISGPDKNKRIRLGEQTVLLGRSPSCGLLSDDVDLGRERVAFNVVNGRLHFRASTQTTVFVDGTATQSGTIEPGQQLRAGRSYWQFGTQQGKSENRNSPRQQGLFTRAGNAFNRAIGLEHQERVNVKEVFSAVAQKRSEHDVTEFLTIGTSKNTPELKEIDPNWPRPWVFIKALMLTVAVYLGFVFAFRQFQNDNLIPGLIMIGASAMPITVVIFYFEMNAPRNVSLHQVIRMLFVGGLVSLVTSLFGFRFLGQSLNWLGASQAGIIEETGKLLALLIVVNKLKYRWTLNGLLFGGAVGAGFALFESAGYAFRLGLADLIHFGVIDTMTENIWIRALLTPGGHVAWTALTGAALWKVRDNQPFTLSMLKDERFLRVFALAVGLHMIWNSPFGAELPYYGKYLILAGVAWLAIFGFIQDGLIQVRKVQEGAGLHHRSSLPNGKAIPG